MLILYLIVSFIIGLNTILSKMCEERELLTVPIGDLEFYGRKRMFSLVNFLFFPSIFVVWMWIGVCFLSNSILDLVK